VGDGDAPFCSLQFIHEGFHGIKPVGASASARPDYEITQTGSPGQGCEVKQGAEKSLHVRSGCDKELKVPV